MEIKETNRRKNLKRTRTVLIKMRGTEKISRVSRRNSEIIDIHAGRKTGR